MYAARLDYAITSRPRPQGFTRRRLVKLLAGAGAFLSMALVLAQTAHGSTPGGEEVVTVAPGQTLWMIAAERYPAADTRAKVVEIERLNGLGSPALQVGQRLRVPAAA